MVCTSFLDGFKILNEFYMISGTGSVRSSAVKNYFGYDVFRLSSMLQLVFNPIRLFC